MHLVTASIVDKNCAALIFVQDNRVLSVAVCFGRLGRSLGRRLALLETGLLCVTLSLPGGAVRRGSIDLFLNGGGLFRLLGNLDLSLKGERLVPSGSFRSAW
jgi:hypothetical protein